MIFNNTGLTKDSIIFDFDISNIKSYNNNTGFSVTSLTYWNHYSLSDLSLTGYGQTMYDFGLSTSFTKTKSYTIQDRNLVFNRIGYNNASGNTTYPQITLITSTTSGNSFSLSGGYLSSFFKLPDYSFNLAPYRFPVALSIDTWLYTTQNTFSGITGYNDGFFLYLGTKAENKFNVKYSATTDAYTNTASTFYNSGFTYDTSNYLNDIEYNAFGLKLNNDRTLSLRYLTTSGLAKEIKTINTVPAVGWLNLTFTFKNCKKILNDCNNYDSQLLDCAALREGNFKIYANGKLLFEQDCVDELFWLRDLNTSADRQIGIPYTINWGGGSFGLKNSYMLSISGASDGFLLNKNLDSLIQDNFDGSLNANIQRLRMYDRELNPTEVKTNYNYFSTRYNFTKLK
jgi:hypothetical protein